ncbi:hydrolase, alpha/beta hydrolase fold family [Luminiphilus syltensis NOR5-1B]|uniref:Hydrolase, alpha/beta hydrolase fold family n=1 Tax=Luminiphilus syltensis NOR5-1B TaxID=565045 RepID=B8KX52_9GAMM|nr:alpha/beta fold hydrolase [Luminiphilus syltensis]EED34828.1 hydrolase, alpha/beta hydrolase fold family [Luminiphilus syltensis NOR5-1B]
MERLIVAVLLGIFLAPAKALDLEECRVTSVTSPQVVDALCTRVLRPENPAQPEGKSISIEVAVLPAQTDTPNLDPVVVIAGGPGQSSIDLLLQQTGNFSALQMQRDIVFVDQRGTGRSNALTCDIDDLETLLIEEEATEQIITDCLNDLPGDPRFYTTAQAVDDLDAIRAALGYDYVNLIGYSYGTRVAQEYLRAYPHAVRAVVLDGVAPPSERLGLKHSENLTRVIEMLIDDCEMSRPCEEAFPTLRADYLAYLAIDPEQSRDLTIRHPVTGEWEVIDANRSAMDVALRLFSYHPVTQAMIPLLLHQVANGDWRTLMAHALFVADRMEGMIAMGMHNSVVCSEDVPGWPAERQQSPGALIGGLDEQLLELCLLWPVGESNPSIQTPFRSDVPVLLLSGERDPVTPPSFAEQALRQFTNGQHIIGLGLGHIISIEPCFERLVASFIDNQAFSADETECAEQRWGLPLVTGLAGPTL